MKNTVLKISLIFCVLSSCQKSIDLKLNNEFTKPKLVLNSLLETDSVISVHISSSASSFNSSSPAAIADASVNLYENGIFKEKLIHQQDGYYASATLQKPIVNSTYEIKVSKNDFDEISASTKFPTTPSITNVVWDSTEKSISFTLADNSGSNYYQLALSIFDTTSKSYYPVGLQTKEKVLVSSDNQNNFDDAGLQQLPNTISDELFDGKISTYKIYYQIFDGNHGGGGPNGGGQNNTQIDYTHLTLSFNASSISVELYNYLKSRQESLDNSGNPFSEPVLVTSNVKNGYGILGGKSSMNFKLK